jgi:DNA anti-recombination protein RmuC
MEFLSLLFILATGIHWLNTQGQRQRTALLAEQLRPYQIEKHMEQLTSAYMRALGEADAERQQQILQLQEQAEQQLADEFQNLAREFAKLSAPATRGFKLALPYIDQLSPKFTFDMRRMLEVHAQGIERAVNNREGLGPKDRSFRMMGEMFLMQHSCHWFCKSKTIASARMVAQHQTRYEQALDAVSTETREAYLDVVQG